MERKREAIYAFVKNAYQGIKVAVPNQRIYELNDLPAYFDTLPVNDPFQISPRILRLMSYMKIA